MTNPATDDYAEKKGVPRRPKTKAQREARNRKNRLRKERRLIRALDRSGWACWWCGRPLMLRLVLGKDLGWWGSLKKERGLVAATLEHLKPKAAGGKNSVENLVAACHKCNHDRPDNPKAGRDIRMPDGAKVLINPTTGEIVARREGRKWIPIKNTM